MNRVFADTSGLIAGKNTSDRHHHEALAFFENATQDPRTIFVLTTYVMAEVHAYFCRTPRVALEYMDYLMKDPLFKLVRPTPADERAALSTLRAASDKTYSFTDAVSFAVMNRLHIQSAFALDDHFRQYGRYRLFPEVK